MSNQIYNWKRFWCPREGVLDLSDGGYLREPNSEWAKYFASNLMPFGDLLDVPCLILLGEPGVGKSYVMRSEQVSVDETIAAQGETLWLNLKAYGDEGRLVRNLFETPKFISWLNGTHTLHIFLDSLDECLLRISAVAALLIDELSKYPTNRLYLRIACRTADWPNSLEKGLENLWGEEAVKAYKLAPLTRNNVIDAASVNGLSPEDFLREIDRMNAVPLAIKPITLKFLIATYRSGRFPKTQAELYYEGCRLLCDETNPDRRAARMTGTLSADQRMVAAARIAAVTMFCNRNAVWADVDYGDMPDENIGIQALCGGNEYVDSGHFQVTETAIQETLSTGLFSSRGMQNVGWAHQTYAEFLAAWYLKHRQMTVPQMLSLLMHSGELGRNLIPQLYETAAWLAGMVPDVFQEIMRINPEVLLRSDVTAVDIKTRVALVDAILKLFDEELLSDRDWGIRGNYKNLKHPGLAEQLRPYILGDDKGIIVRRVATDIAEACELREVEEDLLKVVLDLNQPYEVRVNVAWALSRIADETTKSRLKPLVFGQVGEDPGDDLKGCGLLAMWPQHLLAKELFAVLTYPKRDSYFGAYRSFLGSDFVKCLDPAGLSLALHWTEGLIARYQLSFDFQRIVDAIFQLGWQHLDEADVLDAFAKAIWVRLQYHDIFVSRGYSELEEGLQENDIKRRLLSEAIFSLLVETKDNPVPLVFLRPPLILSKDVLWMLERFRSTDSEREQRIWAELIRNVYDEHNVDQQNAIYQVCQDNSILAQEFTLFFGSVELNWV